jgi:hypothetical protein
MFHHLLSSLSGKKKIRARREKPRARPALECLETRELLSASFPGYVLSNGNLYNTAISSQQPIDTGVQSFAVVNNIVYDLHTGGTLDRLNPDGSGKIISDTGVEAFAVSPLGVVYELNNMQGGVLLQSVTGQRGTFQQIAPGNTVSFFMAPDGTALAFGADGVLRRNAGAAGGNCTQVLGTEVTFSDELQNCDWLVLQQDGRALVNDQSAYTGNAKVLQIVPVAGGFLTLFDTGAIYFDTDPYHLGGGGVGSALAYSGSAKVVEIVRAAGGFLTVFNTGAVYFDTDPHHLGGGGPGSGLAYTGSASVVQIVPVADDFLTVFSTGAVYFDTDPRHLGGGGAGSASAYSGSAKVLNIVTTAGDFLTFFDTGAVYFDTDPRHLGGGGAGSALAYSGSAEVVQVTPVVGGFLTWFNSGALYFDTDPRHLGGGGARSCWLGNDVTFYAPVADATWLVLQQNGTALVNGQLAYSGSAKVLEIAPVAGGFLTWFNSGALYFDTDPRHLGGGGAGSRYLDTGVSAFARGGDGNAYFKDASETLYCYYPSTGSEDSVYLSFGGISQWTLGQSTPAGFGSGAAIGNLASHGSLTVKGLPLGLTYNPSETSVTVSGTPTVPGQSTATLIWTDPNCPLGPLTAPWPITINPLPSLGSISTTQWRQNQTGSATIMISGGSAPFHLDPFLAQQSSWWTPTLVGNTVTISGVPPSGLVGFSFWVTVIDSAGATTSQYYTINVNPPPKPPPPVSPSPAMGWHISFQFSGDIQIPLSWIGWDASSASNVSLALQAAYNYFAEVAYPNYLNTHTAPSQPFTISVSYVNSSGQVFPEGTLWSNQTGP